MLHELSFGASCLAWWPSLWTWSWDAILAVCPLLQSGLIPALLARRQKVPFIFHVQDLQLDAARELAIIRQPLLFACLTCLERFLFTQAQAVTTISRAMAARIQDKGTPPERLHLLPNWADLEDIRPGSRRNALRRELGLNAEVMVLYAGNMGEKQGLEVILDAAAITRYNHTIRYVFVGEGAARKRLMDRAQRLALENGEFLALTGVGPIPSAAECGRHPPGSPESQGLRPGDALQTGDTSWRRGAHLLPRRGRRRNWAGSPRNPRPAF